MAGRFEGKVVLVTGAASGIGRAAALAFAREEAKVVVSDIVIKGGKETVQMIKKAGGKASFVKADISLAQDVQALIRKTVETYGRLDCAFNNAGVEAPMGSLIDFSEEDFDRNIHINLKGTWLCLKYEIAQMVKQGGGIIVNTASTAGLRGAPTIGAYGASKGGIIQLTYTAAIEYGKDGIRINAVCPGFIATPMLQRLVEHVTTQNQDQVNIGALVGAIPIGQPEDIAETAVWLCSDAARFINGHAIVANGGSAF